MKKMQWNKGFTLIELIVIMTILVILASITIPAMTGYTGNALDKDAVAQCARAVNAATTLAIRKDAIDETLSEADAAEILALGQVDGTIAKLQVTDDAEVKKLTYATASGIAVTYQNGEYKMGKGADFSEPGVVDEVYTIIKGYTGSGLDSGAAVNPDSGAAKAIKDLEEAGFDFADMDISSWSSRANKLYFTPGDIQHLNANPSAQTYAIAYNPSYTSGGVTYKTFVVWKVEIKQKSTKDANGNTVYYNYINRELSTYAPSGNRSWEEKAQYDIALQDYYAAMATLTNP